MIHASKFKCDSTGRIFPIMGLVDFSMNPSDSCEFREAKEYRLSLHISTTFRAPKESFKEAEAEAVISIKRLLFEKVLIGMTEIRQAVYSGDPHAVLDVCNKLEEGILR